MKQLQADWERTLDKHTYPYFFPPRLIRELKTIQPKTDPKLVVHIRNGGWLFIKGEQGTGKTLLAAAYMLESMRQGFLTKKEPLKWHHKFQTMTDLLMKLKSGYSENKSEMEILNCYFEIPVLVLDDLDTMKVTDWTLSMIYAVINKRYENLKSTIITTNKSGAELADVLDDRIVGRISEMSYVIELTKVHRGKAKQI